MDANEMLDTMMRELNEKILSDGDGSEEQESFSFHEETQDSDDIPASLLCYFEASKSRAAVCEKLILEDLEASPPSHHTEDMMNFPSELDEDVMKLNEQGICDEENEENNTSTDPFVLPLPTETDALFTDVVSVCPNNEDEYVDIEKQLTQQYQAEREKRHCEEMKKEERRRQRERDFQEELQKIMEAERLHQKELELMGKRAQEKLEQELLLQQELISNLKRRVEEERKMREEEQKRIKDEEDKRRREEEKIKMEAERKRMEKERKIEEMKLKKEEEQKRRMEREEQRKREEEKLKMEAERKRMEEEMRKKEDERKIEEMKLKKEEEEKRRLEREEKRRKEEEKLKMEAERKRMEEEMRKKEDERKIEEMKLKKEEEEKRRLEREEKRMKEELKRMKDEEDKRRREEEKIKMEAEKKRMEEERKIEVMKHKNEEEKKRKMEMEEMRKMREGEQKRVKDEEDRRREEETKKMEAERNKMEEKMRRKKEEERKIQEMKCKNEEEERRRMEEERHKMILEKKQLEDEIRMMEEEERKKKEEAERRERKEEEERKELESRKKMEREKRKLEEEISLKKKEEEEIKKEEEENVRIEKEMKEEENKKEVNKKTEEGGRLKEESKERMVQEKEVKVEDEENSLMDENEKKNKDKTENTLASPQHDTEESISQTSTDQSVDSTVSVFSPVYLPEHTERKRLSWMRDCVPWSKLSLRNRRKQKGSVRGRRGPRGAAEAGSLPPLCPHSLLRATGWKSLQEVTTVTLEDLPGCSLSTLTQCSQLRSLTLRRCGLRSLDSIKQLPQLCYIDVQENDISFVDCENMTSLRVLHLSYNKLTSIHGLTGAENLDVLDLAHNSITRIAGLESVRRLQRLSVDHNQLISTKGLRDIYTLLHLNLSHNHLAGVEGLENSALLHTLDLRANSLTEPPTLNNQVLLRELHLDDNSISSLQSLTVCWLPLMLHLSVAQNRITQLPSMSDSVSLTNLDLRFNCMSEIQNVCESLEGCQFLREVHLTGNPLQQETGWRSTLQKAVPGLRLIDDQQTDSVLTPPVVQQFSSASGSFLMFCQAQLQQTQDLQQRHSRELSDASSSLDALKTSCRHSSEALQLAEDQRFAHEYGDTTVTDKRRATSQTAPEDTPDVDHNSTEKSTELPGMESTGKVPQFVPHGDRCSYWSSEEKSAAESQRIGFHSVTAGPKTGLTGGKANSGSVHSSATTSSSSLDMAPVSNHQNLQSTAAVVIQQLWRKYRQKCGNSSSSSTAEKGGGRGGDGGKPESGPSYINGSVVGTDYAATVIQAFWRGFTLRRRLASALAAVTCFDSGEDDTFEEVDVDEFVFDEAALEKQWMLSLSEDSPPRRYPVSEQRPSVKPPAHFSEPSQYILPPPAVRRPKQAWVSGEQVDSAGRRVSPETSNRSKSPASASVLSGLSERSEKILEEWGFTDSNTALLMLKRAQKMKPTKQKRRRDPSVRLALFRNCSYQLGPVEARNRPTQHNRNDIKVAEAEPGLQQAEKVERVKQERAQQWLLTQAAHSDRDSESVHFLPEISSDVLNGGRVQLVADPGYTERRHHARGLWANNSLAAQPCRENNYPRRNSVGCARKEVPSPQRVTSAPSKKERISFRDNPVELSGGWGGGKKRDKVYK